MNAYEMSAYLQFHMADPIGNHTIEEHFPKCVPIHSSAELEDYLKERVAKICAGDCLST